MIKRVAVLILPAFIVIFCCIHQVNISECKADIDADGYDELLCIKGRYNSRFGSELVVLKNGRKAASYDLRSLKPWKVMAADIDGDGKKEVSIGVYKKAQHHPVMAKRPFLYSWSEKGLSPKWLGSRLSRPFDDYGFCDMDQDGMDELVSIELLENGRKIINAYKWKGFGFESIGESLDFQGIAFLEALNYKKHDFYEIAADIMENEKWKQAVFIYQAGRLIKK